MTQQAPGHPMPGVAYCEKYGITPGMWAVLNDLYPACVDPHNLIIIYSKTAASGLDINKRPYHLVKMNTKQGEKEVVWESVNLARMHAQRSGRFGGVDPCNFGPVITITGKSSAYGRPQVSVNIPEWAQVTAYRTNPVGPPSPIAGPYVMTSEFIRDHWNNIREQWVKRPYHMLQLRAESHALTRAFCSNVAETPLNPIEMQAGVQTDGSAGAIAGAMGLLPESEDPMDAMEDPSIADPGGEYEGMGEPPVEQVAQTSAPAEPPAQPMVQAIGGTPPQAFTPAPQAAPPPPVGEATPPVGQFSPPQGQFPPPTPLAAPPQQPAAGAFPAPPVPQQPPQAPPVPQQAPPVPQQAPPPPAAAPATQQAAPPQQQAVPQEEPPHPAQQAPPPATKPKRAPRRKPAAKADAPPPAATEATPETEQAAPPNLGNFFESE